MVANTHTIDCVKGKTDREKTEIDRQADRQTDGQTDRQTDRHTHAHTSPHQMHTHTLSNDEL